MYGLEKNARREKKQQRDLSTRHTFTNRQLTAQRDISRRRFSERARLFRLKLDQGAAVPDTEVVSMMNAALPKVISSVSEDRIRLARCVAYKTVQNIQIPKLTESYGGPQRMM